MKNVEKVMQSVAKRITQRILGGRVNNEEFISGMAAGLQSAGYPELSDALTDWESAPPEELSKLINRWAGERIFKSDLTLDNPVKSRKENYSDFNEWETDAFRAGATQVVRLGEDLFSAIKMNDGSLVKLDEEGFVDMRSRAGQMVRRNSTTVGSWYGDRGEINRQLMRSNPVKQRIGISLSKSRRRNPLESGATISDDEDINDRASNMG